MVSNFLSLAGGGGVSVLNFLSLADKGGVMVSCLLTFADGGGWVTNIGKFVFFGSPKTQATSRRSGYIKQEYNIILVLPEFLLCDRGRNVV